MTDERIVLLEKALEDEIFVEKIANIESEAALKELFASKGIDMTVEETTVFCKSVRNALEDNDEEFTEESLEDVSGGFGIVSGLLYVGGMYVAGRIVGSAIKKKNKWCST